MHDFMVTVWLQFSTRSKKLKISIKKLRIFIKKLKKVNQKG